jgi:hypothetical protein
LLLTRRGQHIYCAPLPSSYYRTEKMTILWLGVWKVLLLQPVLIIWLGLSLVLHAP